MSKLWPHVFGSASVSSPSIWWDPTPEASPRSLDEREGGLPAQWVREYLHSRLSSTPTNKISVGSNEGSLPTHVDELVSELNTSGADITLRSYIGGHDQACWRGELLSDLQAFRKAQ